MQAQNYVPERHPDVALAVRILEHHRVEITNWREPREWDIEAPISRPYLVDAIAGITHARWSKGLRAGNGVVVNGVRYDLLDWHGSFEDTLQAEQALLISVTNLI